VTFEEFEQHAWREWERIPEQYRAGVDGLSIERKALAHPSLPDVYTLGECVTESFPSDFGGPDTTRSLVVLYYGSFFRLSRLDEGFDWESELWETLTHELQHHLESLASDDGLIDMDYAADENYRRYEGEPFDPLFFRHGVLENGWYRVEDEFFHEVAAGDGPIRFEWRGAPYAVDPPAATFDIALLTITDGVEAAPGALHVAVVKGAGLVTALKRLVSRRAPVVLELDVVARPA
jgi:hypothetical protein